MPKVIAFSGKSNSGKTTLICALAKLLGQEGKSVAVIKHDPKNKAEFDTQGREYNKDSYKFSCVAQSVAVISPYKSVIFNSKVSQEYQYLEDSKYFQALSPYEISEFKRILDFYSLYDYVFIEGLKELPYRRIIVAREEFDSAYIAYGEALAVSKQLLQHIDKTYLNNLVVLDLDNPHEILDFIKKES